MTASNSTYFLSSYSALESGILSATLIIIILVSITGGLIMLYVLYSNDKMWTSTNMLIGNLAVASTSVAVLVMPFSLLSAARREWTFGEGHVCRLTGFTASLLLLAMVFTHTVISIDKYFAVVKPMSRAMTVRKTGLLIAGIWAMASAMSLVPLAGISHYDYNPTTLICGIGFPKNRIDLVYLLILSVVGFVIPINIMIYVYSRVYLAVKQHTARLLASAVLSTDVVVLQKKLILTVFSSLVCFLLCWSTFCALTITAIVIKDRSDLPRGLGIAAYWTGYLNSALNPVIICSMSFRFKEGFFDIYNRLLGLFRCSCIKKSQYLEKTEGQSSEYNGYLAQGTFSRKQSIFEKETVVEKRPRIQICMQPSSSHDDCVINNSLNISSSKICAVELSDI